MNLMNNALMALAVRKASNQTDRALEALEARSQDVEDLEETLNALRGMAGAFNDRFAVARAERDAYRSLLVAIVKELKGQAMPALSMPDAEEARSLYLKRTYEAALQRNDAAIKASYEPLPPEARDGLLNNSVRQAGGGKLIKDFE